MSALRWDDCENYLPGFYIGSEGEDGQHLRDPKEGWPYSIYRHNIAIGGCDVVICHGIQCEGDAAQILDRLQALS
jgi:hypothetical protein